MSNRMLLAARTCVLLAAALACGAFPAGAADRAVEIDAYLSEVHALNQFDGAVLVADRGGIVLTKGYGLADREWKVPNSPQGKFRIGSITKQFTATLVLQLVEEGKLSLDAKLSDVLPYYRKDTGEKVTIRHLLNHTSGIPSFTESPGYQEIRGGNRHGVEEIVTRFCSGDLQFEPGSQFRYNNGGYYILGAVIEKLTGKRYEEVLAERITGPLKMRATGYDHSHDIVDRRTSGYQRSPAGVRNAPYVDMSVPFAAGALYSTVEDLYLWDRALYTDQLLSDTSKQAMFTPGLGNYGFGWGIRTTPVGPDRAERTVISHSGGIEGFHSHIRRIPDDRLVVILLDNCADESLGAVATGIVELMYGREPAPPKRSIAEVMYQVHREQGMAAAVDTLRGLRADKADEYDFSEGVLNLLGYQLLSEGEPEAAVEVFRVNAEIYPESANVYDSLGEGLAALGRTEDAIKSYARSLELDPTNRNAVEWLERLTNRRQEGPG